jgi:solute:Na+ symporter, SSS family
MNMHWVDWTIITLFTFFLVAMAWRTKKYTKSVADFLAADRCVGRYLITMCGGMASLGAVSFIAIFEMRYEAGFVPSWWILMPLPMGLIIAISGWVVYRFRETRVLTLAQFFEIRYSKNFRIFSGFLIFLSGILNFGIFPAIGARFFIYFCGLPQTYNLLGMQLSTYVLILILLLSIALFFTSLGGQITVIVTDFIQSAFCNIMFVTLAIFFLVKFDWSIIIESLSQAPKDASMIHPFHTSQVENFNFWYFLIMVVGGFYGCMAWQGTSAYNCSPKTPHEARMGRVLGTWREIAVTLVLTVLPICAYAVMHHPNFAPMAAQINQKLTQISSDPNDISRVQMVVPIVLARVLPVGFVGVLCAMFFAAFISTHDTYLHSWGSILIQDIILPFRKKSFTARQHLWLLRLSIAGVAVFVFCFSLVFRQTQQILMFFALTGAIWMGGAGAVIIGGLYWKRGTTAGAWTALILGSSLPISALILEQVWKSVFNLPFPINGQWMYLIAITIAISSYILVSLLGKKTDFNINRMLHRGQYAMAKDHKKVSSTPRKNLKAVLIGEEASKGDRVIYICFLIYCLGGFSVFCFFSIYNLICDVPISSWANFWHFFVWFNLVLAALTTIWYTIGGLFDLKYMFNSLKKGKKNKLDDGIVVDYHNLGEDMQQKNLEVKKNI